MPYRLIIRSLYNEHIQEYESLHDILNDWFPLPRYRDLHKDFERINSDLETVFDALDIPYSPEDDSACTFRIQKIS